MAKGKWRIIGRNRFSNLIQHIIFLDNSIRSSYVDVPEWNEVFFVMETENNYFGVYWYTTS
ncbi:hypothetical protein LIT25_11865 [Bacillus sp. F19]|nr:hypothetical protein LIT25_11865 [Bacillus sp. F19]